MVFGSVPQTRGVNITSVYVYEQQKQTTQFDRPKRGLDYARIGSLGEFIRQSLH